MIKVGIKLEHCHVAIIEGKDRVELRVTTPYESRVYVSPCRSNTTVIELTNSSHKPTPTDIPTPTPTPSTCEVPNTKIAKKELNVDSDSSFEVRLCTRCMRNPCTCSSGLSKAIGMDMGIVGGGILTGLIDGEFADKKLGSGLGDDDVGVFDGGRVVGEDTENTSDEKTDGFDNELTLSTLKFALGRVQRDPIFFRRLIARYVMNWKPKSMDMYETGEGFTHVQVPPLATRGSLATRGPLATTEDGRGGKANRSSGDIDDYTLFFPECKPEDDYEVLVMIIDSWSAEMQEKFRAILLIPDGAYYEVGAYGRAALEVLVECIESEGEKVVENR